VLKNRWRRPPKEQIFHHNVYVILLDNAAAKHRSILRLNPSRDPLKPCIYVGMTGIPVDHRFENHKNGYKSAWSETVNARQCSDCALAPEVGFGGVLS
jgi:hypothetical protein